MKLKQSALFFYLALSMIFFESASADTVNQASNNTELQQWETAVLPARCQQSSSQTSFENDMFCANHYFVYRGVPINPNIIKDLEIWISDSQDAVIEINLAGAQFSNRYFLEKGMTLTKPYKNPIISRYNENTKDHFSYQNIGYTSSGIHVLKITDWSDDGSGVFESLMFVRFVSSAGIKIDKKKEEIVNGPPRLAIKKLGELALGDRWRGELTLQGNTLTIKADAHGQANSAKRPKQHIVIGVK